MTAGCDKTEVLLDVSSRRLAPVHHRHLPARGRLSLPSLLGAFLLTVIKRNQALMVEIWGGHFGTQGAPPDKKKRPGGVVYDPNPTRIQETLRGEFRWGEIQNDDVGCWQAPVSTIKTGRPSWSARWRVYRQPTQSSVSQPEAEGATSG